MFSTEKVMFLEVVLIVDSSRTEDLGDDKQNEADYNSMFQNNNYISVIFKS